jgi:negative regulator of sigma E activity
MNDARRLELEQYFDGELPGGPHSEVARQLAEDPEARRYLNQLSLLRGLARRHDPLADVTAIQMSIASGFRARSARARAATAAAVAAGIVAAVVWRNNPNQKPTVATVVKTAAPLARAAPVVSRRSRWPELAAYAWANATSKRPESAALALLAPKTRGGRRRASVEILALRLANAQPDAVEKLEQIAVLRKPPPGGHGRHDRHERRSRSPSPRA